MFCVSVFLFSCEDEGSRLLRNFSARRKRQTDRQTCSLCFSFPSFIFFFCFVLFACHFTLFSSLLFVLLIQLLLFLFFCLYVVEATGWSVGGSNLGRALGPTQPPIKRVRRGEGS